MAHYYAFFSLNNPKVGTSFCHYRIISITVLINKPKNIVFYIDCGMESALLGHELVRMK